MAKVNTKSEDWIDAELDLLRKQHRYRSVSEVPTPGGWLEESGQCLMNLASNDYLNLARHPDLAAASVAAAHGSGVGAGASRLVTGTLPDHTRLETLLARHKGYPSALLFGSGYLTNAGVIPALVGRKDHVFADRLVHASMLDAVKLSGATLHRFRHNDVGHLEQLLDRYPAGRRLILTESVFSMDGDLAPIADIAGLAFAHEALLMIDEAHAGGVFGPEGAGLVRDADLCKQVNCSMGTLSKAFGSYGGYVVCSKRMREWLINRSRALIYTTALPPTAVQAARAALSLIEAHPDWGAQLLERAQLFRQHLQGYGLDTYASASQIVPIHIGSDEATIRVAMALRRKGLLVAAIRPPTVPVGKARLRCSITLAHQDDDLAQAAELIHRACRAEGIPS